MAASALRHYTATATGSTILTPINSTTIPTARALVIGKIIISSANTATYGAYTAPSGGGAAFYFMPLQSMAAGAIYSETGLVLTTGEALIVAVTALGTGGSVWVQIFGEEVDN